VQAGLQNAPVRLAPGLETQPRRAGEKFNTYRFADYKEKVINLLARVTRVSVETMKIVEAMQAEKR
jgi:hypothetical protein